MYIGQTAITVAIMLFYAVPGYLLVKLKVIKSEFIASLSIILLYVYQPFLIIYSFQKITYSPSLLKDMGIFLALSVAIQGVVLLLLYLVSCKKYHITKYRIGSVAAAFGNVGFLGVPLLEAFLPSYPQAVAFSSIFLIVLNTFCWTVGSYMMTGDKKYISIKKLLLNPPLLALLVALPLFFTQITLPTAISNGITVAGKTTAPLCMLIVGMRFATVDKTKILNDKILYPTIIFKLIIFPLLSFLVTYFLPISYEIKATLFILCCCPTASVVQNLAEIYGTGQDFATNTVIVSTILTIITIPLLLFLL